MSQEDFARSESKPTIGLRRGRIKRYYGDEYASRDAYKAQHQAATSIHGGKDQEHYGQATNGNKREHEEYTPSTPAVKPAATRQAHRNERDAKECA